MRRTLVFGAATAAVALGLTGCPAGGNENIETLYGPPPEEQKGESPADQKNTGDTKSSNSQKQNSSVDEPIEDVYGPPVDIDDVDGKTDRGDVEQEPVPAVYGPPPETLQ